MVRLAEGMGRLVLSGRELTRLAGFTTRVTDLIDVLNDLKEGRYSRTMLSESTAMTAASLGLSPNSGRIEYEDRLIQFEDVPLVTPNGDVLVEKMNFTVRSGMNVLVAGPNGCGKSSLFRILGELWPLFGGRLVKPTRDNLFYVPQRPYLTLGSLRDQVIYP
jgi:ATP-binding cassette subfamily D (ALD) protein 3